MTTTLPQLSEAQFHGWADDQNGPVALHLKQKLLSVEGEGGVIFPPTYADIGYNIDTLSDGTKVAMIDSVGSQANRMEPMFKQEPYAQLVPQIEIELQEKNKDGGAYIEKRSLLDLAHRSADAVVYATPKLSELIAKAYVALHQGNAFPLSCIAPTSMIFGAWDSRGGSGEKRPRLVRSIIRAWDVDQIFSAAQFNSVSKQLDENQRLELEKEAKAKGIKLSVKGFADAPATFRKVSASAAKYMQEFRDGAPNPERRVLGGVRANGPIERDVTINLVALRAIRGSKPEETEQLRRYLLALALLAATSDFDLSLREGCNLRIPNDDCWFAVPRRGKPSEVSLGQASTQGEFLKFAQAAVLPFKSHWPKETVYKFDIKEAKKMLAKKGDQDAEES